MSKYRFRRKSLKQIWSFMLTSFCYGLSSANINTTTIATTVINPLSISSTLINNNDFITNHTKPSSTTFNHDQISHKSSSSSSSSYSEPYISINGHNWPISNFRLSITEQQPKPKQQLNNDNSSNNNNKCIDGETYWNEHLNKCEQCRKECPTGAMVSMPCNRTHNLQCVCSKGFYLSIGDGTCKPCSECPQGYGVWRTCRWSRNTVCRQCQPGTYSGVAVGTLGCIPCTKCGPNQEMISACDGNRDTVCIDRSALVDSYLNTIDDGEISDMLQPLQQQQPLGYNAHSPSTASSSTANIIDQHHQNSQQATNMVYIAMLVSIILFLCLYAVIQLRCNKMIIHNRAAFGDVSTLSQHHPTKIISSSSAVNSIRSSTCPHHGSLSYNIPTWTSTPSTGLYHPPNYNHNNHDLTSIMPPLFPTSAIRNQQRSINQEAKYPNNKTYYELLLNTQKCPNQETFPMTVPLISDDVQHLTIEIRQTLENLLGKDSQSWRLLAKELGYDEKHIVQFEAKASTISNGRTMVDTFKVIRLLLMDWSSQMTTSPDQEHSTTSKLSTKNHQNHSNKPPSLTTLMNALIQIGRVDCARICSRQNKAKHKF